MQGVDNSILNVSLPHIQDSLSASQDQAAWALIVLLLPGRVAAGLWISGLRRRGDRGRRSGRGAAGGRQGRDGLGLRGRRDAETGLLGLRQMT
jgi:hypothetical protein